MKRILIPAVFSLLMTGTSFAQGSTKTVTIKTTINCDHCKQCETCQSHLEQSVYDRKGVKRVEIDDKKMEIKVVYNSSKVNEAEIRKCVAEAGYDADDLKATPEGLAKLDGCCKAK